MTSPPMHSKAWFDEQFKLDGQAQVPEPLRAISEALCRAYNIKGVCDPLYIANVMAVELGWGDGVGHFSAPTERISLETVKAALDRIATSYGQNIPASDPALYGIGKAFWVAVTGRHSAFETPAEASAQQEPAHGPAH